MSVDTSHSGTDFGIAQWRELWQDHRAANGRLLAVFTSFPIVLGAAFTLFTTLASEAVELRPVFALGPAAVIIWWSSTIAFLGVTNAKRFRLIQMLEESLRGHGGKAAIAFDVAQVISRDPPGRAINALTVGSLVAFAVMALAAYGGTVAFSLAQLPSIQVKVPVATVSSMLPVGVAVISTLRIRYYLSPQFRIDAASTA